MAAKKKRYGPARPGRIPVWVSPPAAARKAAREALKRQEKLPKSKRGGLTKAEARTAGITSGVERAKSIARGDLQPAQDIRDFFARFRGIHAGALAKGKTWEDSKVQQVWDLWGAEPMWLAAREALAAAGEKTGPEPNPQQYWSVGPQQPMDTGDLPWVEETLDSVQQAQADLQLRLLMGPRVAALAERLRHAPTRERYFERVEFRDIRPVSYPGADEGWYHDELSGQKVVFEDQFDPPYWSREVPHPPGAFTVGELAALTTELWRWGERVADARESLTPEQRKLAVDTILEAAEGLELRMALMQWQPDSPEEAEAMKRSMLEMLAREDNPSEEFLTRSVYEGRYGEESHLTAQEVGRVDPRRLLSLPGARGEHELFRRSRTGGKTPEKWRDLVDSIRREGVRDEVFVVVEPRTRSRGRLTILAGPQIHEGNHRVRAAVEAGVATIPVTIRYFGKAEGRWTVAPEVPRQSESNPALRGRSHGDCEVLAAHEYWSPRQRRLSAEEHNVRQVAYALKKGRRWALNEAALEMAQLVDPWDVLVPVPDSQGSTKNNRRLARRIANLAGAQVCDALTRRLKVPSSRALRGAGLPPLTVEAHAMLRMAGCPAGRTLLVDNVATTGGTALAAADALGQPCAVLVWAWHRSHRELNPADYDPDLVVKGRASAKRAMDHKAVLEQHERSLRKRRKHKVAVLVPCAQQKPYRESRSHRMGYLPALEGKKVDVWVVSEPMGVFPYEWSDEYPNDAYEFAPEHVKGDVREQLVERIRAWVEKHGTKYQRIFLALPGHHMALVCDASTGLDVNYYDASIGACRELGHCPPTHFRATSRAYVDYLRRSIK